MMKSKFGVTEVGATERLAILLAAPRLQREFKRACVRAVMRSTPPRQSNSLPEWIIEAFVLSCELYIATKVVRVVAQGRLRGLIRLEQEQAAVSSRS